MDLALNPTWKQSQTSEGIELKASAVTYKPGTTGDIPSTKVLIKGRGSTKHTILKLEINGKYDWLRRLVPSKGTHQQ
jgi:hypothetical protein